MEFLPFFFPHPSIHPPIHSAVEIPQAIFGCIGPGFFSFGVYSCNETGYDLFLLRNQVHRCIHLSSLTYYSHLHSHVFFSSPQTVPPMHTLKDHFLSVCGLHPCCVTFVALWFLFYFSASLLCNSIFHHPYTFLPPPSIVLSLSLSFTLSSLFFHPCSLFLSLSSHINPSSLITVDVELNVEMRYMQQGGKLTPFKARPSVPSITLSGTASHLYPVWLIITVTLQRERYVKWARGIFKRFNLEYHSSSVPNKCQREYHYGGLVNQDIERRRMNQRGAAQFNSGDNLCPILLISYLYPEECVGFWLKCTFEKSHWVKLLLFSLTNYRIAW